MNLFHFRLHVGWNGSVLGGIKRIGARKNRLDRLDVTRTPTSKVLCLVHTVISQRHPIIFGSDYDCPRNSKENIIWVMACIHPSMLRQPLPGKSTNSMEHVLYSCAAVRSQCARGNQRKDVYGAHISCIILCAMCGMPSTRYIHRSIENIHLRNSGKSRYSVEHAHTHVPLARSHICTRENQQEELKHLSQELACILFVHEIYF